MIGAILFVLAQAAQAAEPPVRVGSWEVVQREGSCALNTSFRSGTLLRIEYFPQQDDYFLLLAEPSWPQIVDGRRYPVDIKGNRDVSVNLEGLGVREEGASHVAIYVPVAPRLYSRRGLTPRQLVRPLSPANARLRFESILLDGQALTIAGGDRPKRTLPLSDTAPAFRALAQCADRLAPQQGSLLAGRLTNRGIR